MLIRTKCLNALGDNSSSSIRDVFDVFLGNFWSLTSNSCTTSLVEFIIIYYDVGIIAFSGNRLRAFGPVLWHYVYRWTSNINVKRRYLNTRVYPNCAGKV